MGKILAFVGASLLSAGISHAQELPIAKAGEFLLDAAVDAKSCSYTSMWTPIFKEDWKKPEGNGGVLDKIANGNRNYLKAINSLRGSIEQISDNRRQFNAAIPREIRYPRDGWRTLFNLHELEVFLDQELREDVWLPTSFILTIKYWKGALGLGLTFHERYRINDLVCPPAR